MNEPLILLSPSKGMSAELHQVTEVRDTAPFSNSTKGVWKAVRSLETDEAKKRFKVSDKMWPEVAALWSSSAKEFLMPTQGVQGLYAYNGEAFKFLDAPTLDPISKERAGKQLVVLSALYGVVTANAWIRPYRLEMQMKLEVGSAKSLYALWKPLLTEWLNAHPSSFIIDACSGEYSKAVDWKSIEKPIVQVDFKQRKNGQLKSVSAFSKQARGAFARWVLAHEVHTISDLETFDEMGYVLHSNNDNKLVFLRDSQ